MIIDIISRIFSFELVGKQKVKIAFPNIYVDRKLQVLHETEFMVQESLNSRLQRQLLKPQVERNKLKLKEKTYIDGKENQLVSPMSSKLVLHFYY